MKGRQWDSESLSFSKSPCTNIQILPGRFRPQVFAGKTLSLAIDGGEDKGTPKREGRRMVS